MERLIHKCLQRPIATTVLFTAVVLAGGFAALNLPLEILPSVDFPRLYIQTAWPGASPPAVEADLTSMIEGELSTVNGISKIRSESTQGFSSIEVELLPEADVDYLRFAIQEKLSFVIEKLPLQAHPPRIIKYVPEEIKTSRFMSYHITGPYSDARLRQLALKRIRPLLNSIPGVAGVEVIGGRERQIQIVFDDERLRAFQIFPTDIQTALQEANLTRSLGSLMAPHQKQLITLRQEVRSLHDIETIPVKKANNRLILLRDIARVADTLSPAYSLQRINGQPTILIQIEKEPQTNILTVANQVYGVVSSLQTKLPEGIRLIREDDQSIAIRENLRQLFYRALFSFLVIFLVLTLFMRYLRLAVLIQASIIVSVFFTLLLMFIFHYSLNIITLAGLALGFGILVDNAIVVLENIYRYQTQSPGRLTVETTVMATGEVAMPLIASTLTTLAALLPFLYFLAELQLYYTPFAIIVSLALTASLLVAFFLIPTLAYQGLGKISLLPANHEAAESRAAGLRVTLSSKWEKIAFIYRKILRKALTHPRLTLLLSQYLYRQRLRIGWEEVPYAIISQRYEGFQFYQLPHLRLRNVLQQEVRLEALGRLTHQRVSPLIERENQTYYKVIAFDYLAPYRFSREFVEDFVKNTAAPTGFSLKSMEFRWEDKETQNITLILLLALLLMYMVLAGLYESFSYPLLIFLIIPLSLVGVFLAYYLTDTTFNQAAYIGVIFLMGIVVNNGIILLDRVNQLKYHGNFDSMMELLLAAGSERLRPILMTTFTTIAGLLPLLLLSDQNNPQDIWYTLSLSTIGGLASATVLGLLVLPVLVLCLEKIRVALRKHDNTKTR